MASTRSGVNWFFLVFIVIILLMMAVVNSPDVDIAVSYTPHAVERHPGVAEIVRAEMALGGFYTFKNCATDDKIRRLKELPNGHIGLQVILPSGTELSSYEKDNWKAALKTMARDGCSCQICPPDFPLAYAQ